MAVPPYKPQPWRVEVDLAGTNEDFFIDFEDRSAAQTFIDRSFADGSVKQERADGVAIYHPLACVRKLTCKPTPERSVKK